MTFPRRSRRRWFLPLLLLLAPPVTRVASAAPLPTPPVRELSGHTGPVTSLALFPDGKLALTGSRDRTLRIWDLANARTVRTLEGHTGPVLAVAVAADGKRIASAGSDHVVRVWDPATGDLVAMLQGHTGDVVGVAFLPDGQLLSGGGDGLRRWDVDKEETVWRTPANNGGAFDLAVSADGKRAAFLNIDSADVDVWDVAAGRLLRHLDTRTGYLRQGLAITPDGREVIGQENARLTRWEVDSGKKLPLPEGFSGTRAVFSRDGALAANNEGTNKGAEVWDTRTWRQLGSFDGGKATLDTLHALAFAPDNKTLLATTGFHLPDNVPPHTEKSDKLFIYDLTDLGAAPETGPKAGKLSWDELTVRFKPLTGATVDVAASPLHRRRLFPRALADGLDAFYSEGTNVGAYLLLHRTPGLFEQVAVEPDAHLDDVAWDGQHVWLASRRYGILLFDRDGKPVDRISAAAGLLPATRILKLHVLGPGRVLAAGVDGERQVVKNSGWCAVVERPADGKPVKVNTFFRESQLPASWTAGSSPEYSHFEPQWISEPPPTTDAAGKTVRSVWVICGGMPSSESAILRIDADALTFAAYNLQMPNQRPIVTTALPQGNAPFWISPREFLYHVGYSYRTTVGEFVINPNDRKLLVHSAWPNRGHDQSPFLRVGDQVYLPGQRWHRIDPRSWEVEDVGPGLRVDGNLADREVQYYVSGVLGGPAAYVTEAGRIYAISVDPAHPRKIPATLDPPRGKPIPPDGVVEFAKNQTIFYCGQGALRFSKGKIAGNFNVDFPYRNPKADLDAEAARVESIRSRNARRIGNDQERVGLSDDQVRRIGAYRGRPGGPPGPDAAKLAALFQAWEAAAPGPARDEAARPLFAAARAAGDWDAQGKRDYIAGMREIDTPRQWKLLNYEIPTDADK
jgi:hypothetical protein